MEREPCVSRCSLSVRTTQLRLSFTVPPPSPRVKAKVVKNKVSPPYKQAIFDIMFGTGINKVGCLLDVAEKAGVVTRKGTYYYLDAESLGQGREKAIAKLTENPELATAIEGRVRDLSKRDGLLDKIVDVGAEEPEESGEDFVPEE